MDVLKLLILNFWIRHALVFFEGRYFTSYIENTQISTNVISFTDFHFLGKLFCQQQLYCNMILQSAKTLADYFVVIQVSLCSTSLPNTALAVHSPLLLKAAVTAHA